jgi:hypothetical protein
MTDRTDDPRDDEPRTDVVTMRLPQLSFTPLRDLHETLQDPHAEYTVMATRDFERLKDTLRDLGVYDQVKECLSDMSVVPLKVHTGLPKKKANDVGYESMSREEEDRLLSIDDRGSATGCEIEWMLDEGYAISGTNGRADWMMSSKGMREVKRIRAARSSESDEHTGKDQ